MTKTVAFTAAFALVFTIGGSAMILAKRPQPQVTQSTAQVTPAPKQAEPTQQQKDQERRTELAKLEEADRLAAIERRKEADRIAAIEQAEIERQKEIEQRQARIAELDNKIAKAKQNTEILEQKLAKEEKARQTFMYNFNRLSPQEQVEANEAAKADVAGQTTKEQIELLRRIGFSALADGEGEKRNQARLQQLLAEEEEARRIFEENFVRLSGDERVEFDQAVKADHAGQTTIEQIDLLRRIGYSALNDGAGEKRNRERIQQLKQIIDNR